MTPPKGWKKYPDPVEPVKILTGPEVEEPEPVALPPVMPIPIDEIDPPIVLRGPAQAVCRHCGADPMKPTSDGMHTCQCRSERA